MWSNKHLQGFREKLLIKENTETSSSNWELGEVSTDQERGQYSHENIHGSCILFNTRGSINEADKEN